MNFPEKMGQNKCWGILLRLGCFLLPEVSPDSTVFFLREPPPLKKSHAAVCGTWDKSEDPMAKQPKKSKTGTEDG